MIGWGLVCIYEMQSFYKLFDWGIIMDIKDFDALEASNQNGTMTLDGNQQTLDLPDASFVKDADMSRDGMDLILQSPKGEVIVEDYFAQIQPPTLNAPEGYALTPQLVESFVKSSPFYADSGSMSDESPVGAVQEITGSASVTRTDGTTENVQIGTPIFQGDIIETSESGAVNIMFIDETSFAVSEDARLAIDEYVFDPETAEGVTNFSVLKGMFVYTSGLIGREDPDDVQIATPVGSIGIRGTIIAGDVDQGEITVIEGAIVLRDPAGNEMTLATQFETARFDSQGGQIQNLGQQSAADVAERFVSISNVSPDLFSSIDDAANGVGSDGATENQENRDGLNADGTSGAEDQTLDANNDGEVDGTVDENGDGSADGTLQGSDELQDDASEAAGEDTTGDAGDSIGEQPTREEVKQVAQEAAQEAVEAGEDPIEAAQQAIIDTFGDDVFENISDRRTGDLDARDPNNTFDPISDPTAGEGPRGSGSLSPDNTTQGTGTNATDLPPPPDVLAGGGSTDAFRIGVSTIAIDEDITGGLIARLTGINGNIAAIQLAPEFAAFFDLVQSSVNPNVYDVFLASGEEFDFESDSGRFFTVNAQSTDGEFASRDITPVINNINEAPEFEDQTSANFFSATEGSSWVHSFRQEFFDEDLGDNPNLTYQAIIRNTGSTIVYDSSVDGASISAIDPDFAVTGTFDASSAQITLNFGAVTVTADTFTIEIIATDPGGLSETTGEYTFNVSDIMGDGTFTAGSGAVNGGDVFAVPNAVTGGFSVSGTGNEVFFSNLNDTSIVAIGSNNLLNLGDGADSVTVSSGATMNEIVGGKGSDVFSILDVENYISGDHGNDRFELDLAAGNSIIATLNGATSGSLEINGGADGTGAASFFINFNTNIFNGMGDELIFENDGVAGTSGEGGTIDFSAFDQDLIRNIEILNFDNFNGTFNDANDITLRYSDVFDMTDHKGTIVIRGDTEDTLTLDREGAETFMGEQITDATTGDTYDTYFIDDVTVLVDTDIATSVV